MNKQQLIDKAIDEAHVANLDKLIDFNNGIWAAPYDICECNGDILGRFTRKEFEARKAERAQGQHWYDYENQKALRLPPVGEIVEFLWGGVSYGKVEFICKRGNNAVYWMISRDTVDSAALPTAEFRPLDWNKRSARNELAQLIDSHGNLPSGLLADSILAAGYRKCDN